jgi:hypothetical protein
MAQYLLRKNVAHYEIAKFDDSTEPVDVYIFGTRGCSCPSYHSRCKHVRILDIWKAAGEPAGTVYNDEGVVLGNLF